MRCGRKRRHITTSILSVIMFTLLPVFVLAFVHRAHCLCGDSIRWSHRVNMGDVYGMWYGVGYAQHNPDLTNKPNEVGCVTLYITDANDDIRDNWLDWSIQRRNFTDQNWRSYKSNPWSQNSLAGSWLDIRLTRRKRDALSEKRVRVLWDEDGHSQEQVYLYYPEEPGFWTAEQISSWERQMMSRGIDIWYPDDTPRHPDVIKILKLTPHTLVLNHCSDIGNGGIFSLILRRSPSLVQRWEWHQYKRDFHNFELPIVQRYSQVCSSCSKISVYCLLIVGLFALLNFLR